MEKVWSSGSNATVELSTMNTKKWPLDLVSWRSWACLISMISVER